MYTPFRTIPIRLRAFMAISFRRRSTYHREDSRLLGNFGRKFGYAGECYVIETSSSEKTGEYGGRKETGQIYLRATDWIEG